MTDQGDEYRRRAEEEARAAMIAADADACPHDAEEPPPVALRVLPRNHGGEWVEIEPAPKPPVLWAADLARQNWEHPFPKPWATGFPALDKALCGGLRPESVYVLAGPTGQGKSSEAISVALQISQTRPVVYGTSELSVRQVIARAVGQILRVPWCEVFEWGPSEAPRVAEAMGTRRLTVVKTRKIGEFADVCRRAADQTGEAPLPIADYLQHFGRGGGQSDLRVGTSDVIDGFSDLCVELKCPGLPLSSMSRSSARNVKMGTDDELVGSGAESGAIEFDSSGMMVLDIDPPGDDGLRDGRIRLLKHRFGPSPVTVGVQFDGRLGLFVEKRDAALPPDLRAVLDLVRSGETSADSIAKALDTRKATVVEWLALLVKRGVLKRGIGQPIRIVQGWE